MEFNDIRKIIEADSETKDLKLNDLDLLKVFRYLQIRGTIIDGYKPILKTDPYIEIVYLATEDQKEINFRERLKRNLMIFDSDVYVQDATLENFELTNEQRVNVYEKAKYFVDNYSKNNYVKGLYIYGPYATGKSYLLSAIAQELAKKQVTVLMVFMPDLVRVIKDGINERDLESRINQLKRADVLMLDDIGGENMTAWFRDEILLPIIQYRLSAKLPMFFSSNLEMEQLMESFAVSKNKVEYVKAVRLIQRIKDITQYVKLSEDKYSR